MTRQEFIDDVTTFWELRDFCEEQGCEICDDIYDEDSYNEYIDECTYDWVRNESWQDLLNILEGLPSGFDYYRRDSYGDWEGLYDNDLEDYKNEVLSWVDEYGEWDEDDEGEGEEDESESEQIYTDEFTGEIIPSPLPDPIDFSNWFDSCRDDYEQTVQECEEADEEEAYNQIEELLSACS